jgi:hypothetical protein
MSAVQKRGSRASLAALTTEEKQERRAARERICHCPHLGARPHSPKIEVPLH